MPRDEPAIVSRRAVVGCAVAAATLVGAGAGAGAGAASAASGRGTGSDASTAAGSPAADRTVRTPADAIVETVSSRVRGFTRSGIYGFRGIPYGGKVAGERRFLPAAPPEPWTGIRSTLSLGPVCPEPARNWSNDEMAFIADWNDGHPGEDCLTLNVWTPSTRHSPKLPVMVWLHGGGFVTGSGHEQPAYDGTRLAARGAVVVTVTHRLGALGFMDLSEIAGADYAGSGNVGMTDLVLALRWVKDNIANFGGDPSCVTIFGQSGGGAKVSALMAMPVAQGLFHRGIVMSGSFAPAQPQDQARATARAVMKRLGVSDIAGLRAVSAEALVAAGEAEAASRASGGRSPPGLTRGALRLPRTWAPVIDGTILPDAAWEASAPAVSRTVPLMVGSVRDEFRLSSIVIDEAGLRARLDGLYGRDKAPQVLSALRADFPQLGANDLGGVVSGMAWRASALHQLDLKAAQGGAPGYGYWFTYAPDLLDGRIGVPHCTDIVYAFDNCERADQLTGNTPDANRIAATMADAFIRFARTGNPAGPRLPWRPHDRSVPTMVFDRSAQLIADPAARTIAYAR
ncbi:carboxylesterase family protein [Sphingomonas sp. RB3P16]|uniref:carboxylesterase/lipase family protein n=1 Tax=Parasphingomonas frigoris TaxID=3096163 RepID=UPI002FCA2639